MVSFPGFHLRVLGSSNCCTLDPEFFEARAIVFGKMGQHRQTLEIYVFKLEDYAKAEEYAQCPCVISISECPANLQYQIL